VALLGVALGLGLVWAGYFTDRTLSMVAAQPTANTTYNDLAVIYVSGDAGLKVGFGQNLANRIAAGGMPVVTINSLAFFRRHRTLAEVRSLISSAVLQARSVRPGARVVLIGHSLGADAVQAALASFPPGDRPNLAGVVLVVPTARVYLQISPAEMLDTGRPDAAALPSLAQIDWLPLSCIYGRDEKNSPCPLLKNANVTAMPLPGGHGLNRDLDALHRAVLDGIDRTADHRALS
jgi:type IV secretory pathway VirJ component